MVVQASSCLGRTTAPTPTGAAKGALAVLLNGGGSGFSVAVVDDEYWAYMA
jgi:hypothetical protein